MFAMVALNTTSLLAQRLGTGADQLYACLPLRVTAGTRCGCPNRRLERVLFQRVSRQTLNLTLARTRSETTRDL